MKLSQEMHQDGSEKPFTVSPDLIEKMEIFHDDVSQLNERVTEAAGGNPVLDIEGERNTTDIKWMKKAELRATYTKSDISEPITRAFFDSLKHTDLSQEELDVIYETVGLRLVSEHRLNEADLCLQEISDDETGKSLRGAISEARIGEGEEDSIK